MQLIQAFSAGEQIKDWSAITFVPLTVPGYDGTVDIQHDIGVSLSSLSIVIFGKYSSGYNSYIYWGDETSYQLSEVNSNTIRYTNDGSSDISIVLFIKEK